MAILPYRSFAFAMTKHSSKPRRLRDLIEKPAASRLGSLCLVFYRRLIVISFFDRHRSRTRRAQKSNQYYSVRESSGSSAPASAIVYVLCMKIGAKTSRAYDHAFLLRFSISCRL